MTSGPESPVLVVRAPAKVNLTLEVLGKRADGFHALRSVFAALDLHDRLAVYPALDVQIECDVPELASPANLAWRAVAALRRDSGIRAGARLVLEKRIPREAGLGGGSADAAAALVVANVLWNLGYSRARLREIGAEIGSDVPFFLGDGPLALVTGRGEVVQPLPVPPALQVAQILLVTPPIGISAGAVYRAYPPTRWGGDTDRTTPWMRAAFAASGPSDLPMPFNDLEPVAVKIAPEAVTARDAMIAAGAPYAVVSGSGSTFLACLDAKRVANVADQLRTMPATADWFIAVTHIGALPLNVQ
jgi:4-diphosphocytidyl-2-C-methyl-D-erythritol kinase